MKTETIDAYGYTKRDIEDIGKKETMREQCEIAKRVIERIGNGDGVVQMCAPITSGGHIREGMDADQQRTARWQNKAELQDIISVVNQHGIPVFNQLYFESGFKPFIKKWKERGGKGYCMPILEDFYGVLFEEAFIKKVGFLWLYETSCGATYEFNKSEECKIKQVFIDFNWRDDYNFLRQLK